MLILLYLSLPFVAAAAFCFVMADRTGAWTNLGWAIYGALALGLWALVVLVFFLWLITRDGWLVWHGVPLALIVLAVLAGAIWGGRLWWKENVCARDGAFYEALAAMPMAERAAVLDDTPRPLDDLTFCGREMIGLRFLAGRYDPAPEDSPREFERLATLALLLERGLPPDDSLLREAVVNADPRAVRLIIARRKTLGLEPVPLAIAEKALGAVDADPQSPYHDAYDRYIAMLSVMVAEGLDVCRKSGGRSLREAMAARGVPETVWRDAGAACEG